MSSPFRQPNPLLSAVLITCLLAATALPQMVQAQLCFDIFEDLTDPSLSCADVFYTVDGPDGTDGNQFFGGSDSGPLGADFDGFDLFDPADPELAPPANLLEPFFSDVQYEQVNNGGQIDSFNIRHRGSVSFGARDSRFQSASYGSRSKITIIPFTVDGSMDPIILDLEFDFDLTLKDPSDNNTTGVVRSGAGGRIFPEGRPQETLFAFSGLAELDLALDANPTFFGDFDGPPTSFAPSGPGIDDEFDLEIDFDTTLQATPGERLILDTDTFGSIFTDGFESGDTSAWSASSVDTFVFSVGSSDPNVRFMIVTESSQDINYGLAGAWFNSGTSGQGFLFDLIPANQFMFVPWFTFDAAQAGKGGAIAGDELRWFTAQGNYSGNRADLVISQTRNGVFDDPAPVNTTAVGTMVIEFSSCTTATLTYDLPDLGLTGTIPIVKLLDDEICTRINDGEIVLNARKDDAHATQKGNSQAFNYGLLGGWFNTATSGQGFMFDFLVASRLMFVAWFAFDTVSPQTGGNIPGAELRWLTAQGTYGDNAAVLQIFQTLGGVFDDPTMATTTAIGSMTITFDSCTTGNINYSLPGAGLAGDIAITKLLGDEICTRLNNGEFEVR